ncbi:valyl-tRNA synthetase [Aspergillus terreus]|uniref:valine--tRNA ligase n=1 Tax=Aspergillus terreus TaxID=33178 RepID=A0A5M3ZBJ0_ASPTE|nr:hypothetical protein ATETN484_0013031700 [Aspergillus terreus]GFF20551.1 valyl-tRNA synthetase [Aspergillus terreus]
MGPKGSPGRSPEPSSVTATQLPDRCYSLVLYFVLRPYLSMCAHIERDFGTGAVKLTPAHDHNDFNDFSLGKKHDLPFINILNEDAIDVVESGELVIRPDVQKRQYLQWMRNLQDLCLSRQLWWGHQIPAYFITIEGEDRGNDANDDYWTLGSALRFGRLVRSDGQTKTSDLEKYFPNTTMETGWDILPFWVSRMIMSSLKLTGKVPSTEVFCHGLIRDSDGRKMQTSLGNVIDPIDILDGISLDDLQQKLIEGNLAQNEVKNAERYQKKAFPQGIPEVGADALRFSFVHYTQASGGDINFDVKTMQGYRRFCNKIYLATKYVLGKLGDDIAARESSALTGKESLPEKWILTRMNTAAKQINQALEDREFAKATEIIYRYLYDGLFDIYIENSKVIISDGTPGEDRSAMDTLYTTLEVGLRLTSSFMPFLTEELWQRLPRRPGNNTSSITIAKYPEYEPSFDDPRSEAAYELVLGCSKGIRSLIADYAVKDQCTAHIVPLNQMSHNTVSDQLYAIKSLSGKAPVNISILNVGEASPTGCAVFPVSADANVYLEVGDRIQDAGKEAERVKTKLDEARKDQDDIDALQAELSKVQDKDVTETMRSAQTRKRDIEARLRALEEALKMFEMTTV